MVCYSDLMNVIWEVYMAWAVSLYSIPGYQLPHTADLFTVLLPAWILCQGTEGDHGAKELCQSATSGRAGKWIGIANTFSPSLFRCFWLPTTQPINVYTFHHMCRWSLSMCGHQSNCMPTFRKTNLIKTTSRNSKNKNYLHKPFGAKHYIINTKL